MDLQQAADQAMNYLDSVGVAAEWNVLPVSNALTITTGNMIFAYYSSKSLDSMIGELSFYYPQKSPA